MNELIIKIQFLQDALIKSGKAGSAEYFAKKIDGFRLHANNLAEVKLMLKELSTCSPMAQYGNFSLSEEKVLNDINNMAKLALEEML